MKKLVIIMLLLSALILIFSCDQAPMSDADANRMMQEALIATQTEMAAAMLAVGGGGGKGLTRAVYTGEYTNDASTFHIFVTVNDDNPSNITWDGEMTFTNFTTYNGSVINGTVSLAMQMSESGNFTFNYDGDFTIEFEGETYDVTWDITYAQSIVGTTMTINYTGIFLVNGYEYDYSYSIEQELSTR